MSALYCTYGSGASLLHTQLAVAMIMQVHSRTVQAELNVLDRLIEGQHWLNRNKSVGCVRVCC